MREGDSGINFVNQGMTPKKTKNILTLKKGRQISQRMLQKLINPDEAGNIRISDGEWVQGQFTTIRESIESWDISNGLWIYGNQWARIIEDIQGIKFGFLKDLFLWNNNISSIEILQEISMPSLNKLYIDKNNLHTVKQLRKLHVPEIEEIGLSVNFVVDFGELAKIEGPHLNALFLEHVGDRDYCPMYSWSCKLHSRNLKKFRLRSQTRISQPFVINRLKKKYQGIDVMVNQLL